MQQTAPVFEALGIKDIYMKALVEKAIQASPWDLGNDVLYGLCKNNPNHEHIDEVTAKIWLIGRSYAAAIERRKNKKDHDNDDFYIDIVAPKIINSDIDKWLSELNKFSEINEKSIIKILEVHSKVTDLFKEISGLEKRSLASKYLHFHCPHLFYIYDSRAVNAISKNNEILGRTGRSKFKCADNEYRKLVEKCINLQAYIKEHYAKNLSPRQIDNVLLYQFANA